MRCLLALLWLPAFVSSLKAGRSVPKDDDDDPVLAHDVLRAAIQASGSKNREDAEKVTSACVPSEASEAWGRSITGAVEELRAGTKRAMQKGLAGIAGAFIDLTAGTSCGDVSALKRMSEQADRLKVLASYRSLAALDSKVKYEPLKSLTVGDIDVHTELNFLIEAWQLKKGVSEIGTALGQFLGKFADDADEEPNQLSDGAGFQAKHQKHSASYWVDAFNAAYRHLGDSSSPVASGCVPEEIAVRLGALLDVSFETMMQQSKRAMHTGLKQISREMDAILRDLETPCDKIRTSPAAQHLREAAHRLSVLAAVKNLVNQGVNVEYDPKKLLKVAGVDIHLELNRFIGAWVGDEAPATLGVALADFFEDFKEQLEEEDAGATDEQPVLQMIRAAVSEAMGSSSESLKLGSACFKEDALATFDEGVSAAIDHMLQKRKKKMQQGLKELADVTESLLGSQPAECLKSSGAKAIRAGAQKLKRITRKTVVDYGTHIKYEAMKSLMIGGTDVHTEINEFLSAWKLRSKKEAGPGFGKLMKRVSTVSGYDEL